MRKDLTTCPFCEVAADGKPQYSTVPSNKASAFRQLPCLLSRVFSQLMMQSCLLLSDMPWTVQYI